MQSAFRKSAWADAGSKPPYEPYTREIWPGGTLQRVCVKGTCPVTKWDAIAPRLNCKTGTLLRDPGLMVLLGCSLGIFVAIIVELSIRRMTSRSAVGLGCCMVTDEQRGGRPIFNATLRAAAGWLFFLLRGGSTRMNPDMGALPPVRLGPP